MNCQVIINNNLTINVVKFNLSYSVNDGPADSPDKIKTLVLTLANGTNPDLFYQHVGSDITDLKIIDKDDNDSVVYESTTWERIQQVTFRYNPNYDNVDIQFVDPDTDGIKFLTEITIV